MPRAPKAPRGYTDARPSILPTLADVNPGSVTRALAETLAKEVAQIHAQLESVYESSFVETADARDLDAVARLVRAQRRLIDGLFAEAEAALAAGRDEPKLKRGAKKTKKKSRARARRPT